MLVVKKWISGAFWFRDDLSLVNGKNTIETTPMMMKDGKGTTKKQECQQGMVKLQQKAHWKHPKEH